MAGKPLEEQDRLLWAARVRPARLSAGMSQDELAAAAKVSRRTIGNIESARTVPHSAVLQRIDDVLDMAPDDSEEWPLAVRNWVHTVVPLLLMLDDERREDVMRSAVIHAGRSLSGGMRATPDDGPGVA